MEDDINFCLHEDNLFFFFIWKTPQYFLQVEDYLNILANGRRPQFFSSNGRRPQYFGKWKKTLIFLQMEYDLNILAKGEMTSIFLQMEYDLNILANERQPQNVDKSKATSKCGRIKGNLKGLGTWKIPSIFRKCKTTSIFWQTEDDLSILVSLA